MKKILLIGLILILCTSFASAYEIIINQTVCTDMGSTLVEIGSNAGTFNWAEKIIPSITDETNLFSVFVCEKGDTTGYKYNFSIYSHNATGDSPLYMIGTSVATDLTSLPACPTGKWVNFSLINKVSLVSGTPYWVVGHADTIDAANNINWCYNDASSGTRTEQGTIIPAWTYYSNNNGLTYIVYDTEDKITFENPTPSNNTFNNTYSGVIINVSSEIGNITVYWNNTLVGNGSESSPFSFGLNSSLVTGTGLYTYFANNGINNITYLWTYDNVLPNITLLSNSSFNSNNVTTNFNELILNFNFSDNLLVHAYLINITKNGISYYSEINESYDIKNKNYYKIVDLDNQPFGTYIIDVFIADGHTAIEIDKYAYTKPKNAIEYDTDEGNKIKISTLDSSTFTTEKKKDKYSFSVSYNDKVKQKDRTIYIESDNKLIPIKNNKYQGWFASINWAEKKGNWIDLEGEGKVKKITKITDYKYEVVYEAESDMITFNSIGGLNFAYASYEWENKIVRVDNCSNYNYTISNFSYFDETDLNIINVSNSYNLNFISLSENLNINYNSTSNNYYTSFCSNKNISGITLDINGQMLLEKTDYASLFFTLADSLFIAKSPFNSYSVYMTKLNESSTVNFNWYTTEYSAIDGTLLIYRCSGTGDKTLIESTPITDSNAVANLRLLDVPYSYSVIYNGEVYTDDTGFSACHIESETSITYYIDISQTDISPYIGLQGINCNLLKTSANTFNFSWGTNAYDTAIITGCIFVERLGVNGYIQTDSFCSNSSGIERTIPATNYNYLINSKIYQSGYSKSCNQISFNLDTDTGDMLGLSGIFAAILLFIAMVLLWAEDGETSLIIGILALIIVFIIGITKFSWVNMFLMIAFLGTIAYIGRYLRNK